MAVAVNSEVREAGLSQHLRKGMLRDSSQETPDVATDIKELWWPIHKTYLRHTEILNVGKKHPSAFQLLFLFLSTLSLVVYPMGYVKELQVQPC